MEAPTKPPGSPSSGLLPDAAALPDGFVASSSSSYSTPAPHLAPPSDAATAADDEDYKVPLLDVPLLSHHPQQQGESTKLHEDEGNSLEFDGQNNVNVPKHDCLGPLKKNEMLRSKLAHLFDEFSLLEPQFTQEMLEMKLEDPKIQLQKAKSANKQTQVSVNFDQDSFWGCNEESGTSNEEVHKMANLIVELKKENELLKKKYQELHTIIVKLVEEREIMKQQLEKVEAQMETVGSASEALQTESNQIGSNDSSSANP